ncbi:uncharacterized protein N7446_010012 [Penicillium canescens]|uniref:uncharacterized protein n=1 Tax=Penicillium canescens TaxID=5083 RepID=UPI0026E066B6|nr:uncharacterized protein N7446_010012 [Penicillium canescens]KAJ6054000.1 hypothetical protein N7446_010012 [Penicillium canescens]
MKSSDISCNTMLASPPPVETLLFLLLRAHFAERLAHFGGIVFARPEKSVSEILNTQAPDLLWTVRGCIVQPPVVHAGPLFRDCLRSTRLRTTMP